MNMKKKLLAFFLAITISNINSNWQARAKEKYPFLDGKVLYQTQFDRVLKSEKNGVSPNNAFIYIEPNFNLNFNQNWVVKTQWRLQPNDVLTTRDQSNPERYRTFLSSNRGMNFDQMGFLVEEIKIQYQNDDIKIFAGKYDPTFGNAHRKSKRIGVFSAQFAEDYNLREKIGLGAVALLESSQITFNTFFNDTTDLSSSVINNRGRANKKNTLSGATSTISSYSVSMEGEDLFDIKNLFYNFGYRSLGVEKAYNSKREIGYVLGGEYLHKFGNESSIIPFVELVDIKNLSGISGRNAQYITLAIIGNYRNWTTSISNQTRNIEKNYHNNYHTFDRQSQLSIGYRFTNNITLDIARAEIREDAKKGSLVGINLSYVKKF
jgi:hypothetical protein